MNPLRLLLIGILLYVVMRAVRKGQAAVKNRLPSDQKPPLPASSKTKIPIKRPPREQVDGQDPYELIGVSESATDQELSRAYQKAIKQYHPDQTAHLGRDLQELAERRTRQLNRAYEILSLERASRAG